jgi:hypothetical protein
MFGVNGNSFGVNSTNPRPRVQFGVNGKGKIKRLG